MFGVMSRLMRRKWQLDWGQRGPVHGSWQTCSNTASPCRMRPASTAHKVPHSNAFCLLGPMQSSRCCPSGWTASRRIPLDP